MSIRKGRLTSTGVLAAPVNFPTGCVLDFAGDTAPDGWLLCYGQAVSRTDYASLFATLGTTYGSGDGSTTFNLPDYRGRVLVGKDNMGGSVAGRMTTAGAGIDGISLGASGGAQTHALTTAQLAVHTHIQNSHVHTIDGSASSSSTAPFNSTYPQPLGATVASGSTVNAINSTTPTNQNTGSGTAHQNTQPSIIANKIIKV